MVHLYCRYSFLSFTLYLVRFLQHCQHYSLFLVGSCDAKTTLKLVIERLEVFNLNLITDIIAATNDGAAVMKKFGQLSIIINQLCYSHAIHLAVTDILYKNENSVANSKKSNDETETEKDEFLTSFESDDCQLSTLCEDYSQSICNFRKICNFFRKSQLRNSILQKYVKEAKGKELNLILDCKTRWNSLEAMMERIITLKECIVLALSDIGASHMWNDDDYYQILELQNVLRPVRLAAEALGRKDANLITSEGIFEFLLNELKKANSDISSKLSNALETRINERRQVELITLLLYLQNPDNISVKKSSSVVFSLASKPEIIKLSGKILSRIYPNSYMETSSDNECVDEEGSTSKNNILKEAMEKSINKFLQEPGEKTSTRKTLTAEFSVFEATNKRTKNLDVLFEALKTIKPSSVASERVFSVSNNFVSKIRNRLSDESVDILCFLKSYFLNKNFP